MSRPIAITLLLLSTLALAKDTPTRDTDSPKFFPNYGTLTNPDDDCDVTLESDTLTFAIPSTPHDFAAELQRFNAPRVMSPVKGDFIVEVKVTGDFSPADQSTIPNRKPYNGAGILVVADEDNHLSLQRAAFHTNEGTRHYLNLELRHDGECTVSNFKMNIPDGDTYLRLERRGPLVTASVSQDHLKWRSYDPIEVSLPNQLHVGLEAVNSSQSDFRCTFSDYALFTRQKPRTPKTPR